MFKKRQLIASATVSIHSALIGSLLLQSISLPFTAFSAERANGVESFQFQVHHLNSRLLNGLISKVDFDREANKLILENAHLSAQGMNKEDRTSFFKFDQLQTVSQLSRTLMMRALQQLSSNLSLKAFKVTPQEGKILANLGQSVEQVQTEIFIRAKMLLPEYRILISKGAKFSVKTDWDFSGLGEGSWINPRALSKSPALVTALAWMTTTNSVAELIQVDRKKAIQVGGSVALPVSTTGPHPGSFRFMTRNEYQSRVEEKVRKISASLDRFKKYSKEASSYSDLMSGYFESIFYRGERGHQGKTAAEINMESSYDEAISLFNELQTVYGTRDELKAAIRESLLAAGKIQKSDIEAGMSSLNRAQVAMVASAAIPVALYLAPIAGAAMAGAGASAGLLSGTMSWTLTSVSLTGQAAVASMSMIPMAFTLGGKAMHAWISSSSDPSVSFKSAMQDGLPETLSQGLITSAAMTFVPVVGSTVGAIGTATGMRTMLVAGESVSLAKGIYDLGVATYFTGMMAVSGYRGALECFHSVKKVQKLSSGSDSIDSSMESSNEGLESAIENTKHLCAQAGIDLGFAMVPAFTLGKSGRAIVSENKKMNSAISILGLNRKYTEAQLESAYSTLRAKQVAEVGKNPAVLRSIEQTDWAYRVLRSIKEGGVVLAPTNKDDPTNSAAVKNSGRSSAIEKLIDEEIGADFIMMDRAQRTQLVEMVMKAADEKSVSVAKSVRELRRIFNECR